MLNEHTIKMLNSGGSIEACFLSQCNPSENFVLDIIVPVGVGISLRMKMINLKFQIKTCINERFFNGNLE